MPDTWMAAAGLVAAALGEYDGIALTTHRQADGDGIGCELALLAALEQMGKVVTAVNSELLPDRFRELPGAGRIEVFSPEAHSDLIRNAGAVLLVDAADPSRTGPMAAAVAAGAGAKIAIDHHLAGGWAEIELIDASAPSATALVYPVLQRLPVTITPEIATSLLLGLFADTGGFLNDAAGSRAHKVAAELLDAGADREMVVQIETRGWGIERVRLKGRFLSRLESDDEGRIAWGVLTAGEMELVGGDQDTTDGLADEALRMKDVEVAALLIEEPAGTVRVRLRSRRIPVSAVAAQLGGGGHPLASGARIDGPMEAALNRTLEAVRDVVYREAGKS